MSWIISNAGTIAVVLILALIIGLIIFKLIRDKKNNKSSCGCNCSSCPSGGCCSKKM